jgi:transcriptional regulator GlxA family with amidase domain
MDSRVQKIQQIMRDNLDRELPLVELAQYVNLSPWRLCHLFRADTGMPPIKYLRQLRLEAAKQLLEVSFLSIKEITYKVGINDESHFVRDFKRMFGMPPSVYRMSFSEQMSETKNKSPRKNPQGRLAKRASMQMLSALNIVTYAITATTYAITSTQLL